MRAATINPSIVDRFAFATAAVALFAVVLCVPETAEAAPYCGPRNQLVDQLAKRYSEAPVAVGLSSSGALVEVLTSDGGATWTILLSRPDGTSCLVAVGEEWQALKHVANGELGS